jgi:diphthine synthase
MVTIMSDRQSAVSAYNSIFENLHASCHTLILTEYNFDLKKEPFFLDPMQVFKLLSEVEEVERRQIFSDKTFAVVASRIGMPDQQIISGRVRSLLQSNFGNGPHSIVVTGPLHFTESDALTALTRSLDDPSDNSHQIKKISTMMLERYSPSAKLAVRHMRDVIRAEESDKGGNKGMFEVLDNAEYYISDAERFLRQGKDELAVLSIGYAEGLVDALRFQKGINPWEKLG